MHLDSDTQIPPALQEFLPIGVLADAIAKDCIMRAYVNGALTIDEASEWIEEFGLKSA